MSTSNAKNGQSSSQERPEGLAFTLEQHRLPYELMTSILRFSEPSWKRAILIRAADQPADLSPRLVASPTHPPSAVRAFRRTRYSHQLPRYETIDGSAFPTRFAFNASRDTLFFDSLRAMGVFSNSTVRIGGSPVAVADLQVRCLAIPFIHAMRSHDALAPVVRIMKILSSVEVLYILKADKLSKRGVHAEEEIDGRLSRVWGEDVWNNELPFSWYGAWVLPRIEWVGRAEFGEIHGA